VADFQCWIAAHQSEPLAESLSQDYVLHYVAPEPSDSLGLVYNTINADNTEFYLNPNDELWYLVGDEYAACPGFSDIYVTWEKPPVWPEPRDWGATPHPDFPHVWKEQ
jgi:hypothetical protein